MEMMYSIILDSTIKYGKNIFNIKYGNNISNIKYENIKHQIWKSNQIYPAPKWNDYFQYCAIHK